MSEAKRVPASDIERIVGTARRRHEHMGRAVSAEQEVYILHSQDCLDSDIDLLDCPFTFALEEFGIDTEGAWAGHEDEAVVLRIVDDELVPEREPQP